MAKKKKVELDGKLVMNLIKPEEIVGTVLSATNDGLVLRVKRNRSKKFDNHIIPRKNMAGIVADTGKQMKDFVGQEIIIYMKSKFQEVNSMNGIGFIKDGFLVVEGEEGVLLVDPEFGIFTAEAEDAPKSKKKKDKKKKDKKKKDKKKKDKKKKDKKKKKEEEEEDEEEEDEEEEEEDEEEEDEEEDEEEEEEEEEEDEDEEDEEEDDEEEDEDEDFDDWE